MAKKKHSTKKVHAMHAVHHKRSRKGHGKKSSKKTIVKA
jgi:hypothetical protein